MDRQPTLFSLGPYEEPPPRAVEYWQAVDAHYAHTKRRVTDEDLCLLWPGGKITQRSISRWRRKSKTFMPRQPRYGQRPPWESQPPYTKDVLTHGDLSLNGFTLPRRCLMPQEAFDEDYQRIGWMWTYVGDDGIVRVVDGVVHSDSERPGASAVDRQGE